MVPRRDPQEPNLVPNGPQEGPRWTPEVEKPCVFWGKRVSLTRFPQNTKENTARAMPKAAQMGQKLTQKDQIKRLRVGPRGTN